MKIAQTSPLCSPELGKVPGQNIPGEVPGELPGIARLPSRLLCFTVAIWKDDAECASERDDLKFGSISPACTYLALPDLSLSLSLLRYSSAPWRTLHVFASQNWLIICARRQNYQVIRPNAFSVKLMTPALSG